jgi:hypothetical protein
MLKIKTLTITCILFSCTLIFAQEGVMRITHNPELIKETPSKENYYQKSTTEATIDSTFIYTVDTLTLPIFDDFSKNRIQQYEEDFSDPTLTSELFYRVLDENDIPLPSNAVYTTQQTFRRTFDTGSAQTTTSNFSGTIVKVGDLSKYPVVYATKTVYPPYYIFDTIGVPDIPDTIWIVGPDVIQDSARQFFAHAATPGTYWIDDHAYHNYRFAKNPWSIGVMTLDGIDRKGYPYEMGTTLSGVADYLTSKPIDLTGNSISDSLYITFLYQKQGLGDIPESVDSLILEFYDVTAQLWRRQWGTNGGGTSEFKLAHVPIKNPAYFVDAFQFRFKNYGGLSGSLDHFHIDYVHVRDFSGIQDTLIEDFALSYPTISLLDEYTSVPWDHYQNNPSGKMSTAVPLTVRNSYLNGGSNITSAGGGRINIKHDGLLEGSVVLNGQSIVNYNPSTQPIPDYQPRTTYLSHHDVSSYQFDHTKPSGYQSFEIETIVSVPVGSNYLPNDTSYSHQIFSNYYSYDDGSAELAYGPQGTQSRLAIKYTPYEADSIIGARIHFVPTVNDVTGKLFQLTIWADNGGVPGTVLYQDNAFNLRQPSYGYGRNSFVDYYTEGMIKVPVSGTFFIGWRQIDALRLGVGLDQNTDQHTKTFYSLDGGFTWEQSQIPGSVMINPIFSTSLDTSLGIESVAQKEVAELTIYPNPSKGQFNIRSSNEETGEITVYSLMGNLVLTTNEQTVDLSNHPDGIYLVKSSLDFSKTYKVVKAK